MEMSSVKDAVSIYGLRRAVNSSGGHTLYFFVII